MRPGDAPVAEEYATRCAVPEGDRFPGCSMAGALGRAAPKTLECGRRRGGRSLMMAGYAATLRAVLLHSGDVLPDVVQEYLGKVGRSRDRDFQEFVLLTYVPLVDRLPDAYTEFALQVLR